MCGLHPMALYAEHHEAGPVPFTAPASSLSLPASPLRCAFRPPCLASPRQDTAERRCTLGGRGAPATSSLLVGRSASATLGHQALKHEQLAHANPPSFAPPFASQALFVHSGSRVPPEHVSAMLGVLSEQAGLLSDEDLGVTHAAITLAAAALDTHPDVASDVVS